MIPSRSWRVAALAAGWFASLAATTWFVLEPLRDALLPLFLDQPRPGMGLLVARAAGALHPWQAALVLAAAGLGLLLCRVEWRRGGVSALLRARGGPMALLFAAAIAWAGQGYLGHGDLLSGDTIAHVAMLRNRIDATLAGQDPTWSNLSYLGLPLQAFYAPSTFWPLLHGSLLTGAPMAVLRGWLFAMHVASALAAYALARTLGQHRLAAAFAALVYAGSFAHLHLLLYRGALPQALSAALLPLALLFTHRVAAVPPRRAPGWTGAAVADWAGLSASAALLLVNYTPLAVVVGAHMALLAGFGLWHGPRRGVRLLALAGAALSAAALAAGVLVPAALTGSAVLPLSVAHLLFLQWPTLGYLDHLLVWRAWRTDFPGGAAYLGLVALGCAGFGAWSGRREAATRAVLALLALSLVLRGQHVRDILPTVLYVALLAGAGAARLAEGARLGRSGPALVLAAFLLDLGSTSLQPVGRTDKGWLASAGTYLAGLHPSVRTLELQVRGDRVLADPGPGLMAWSPAEFLSAGHVEMATPAWVAADVAAFMAEADLNRLGALSPRTTSLLCLLRVGRVVGVGRTRLGLPERLADTSLEAPLGRVIVPACPFQAVFAPALAPAPMPPLDPRLDYAPRYAASLIPAATRWLDRLLDAMRLDPATGAAHAILVPGAPEPADPGAPGGGAAVRDYVVAPGRVDITLVAPAPGFVRLAHAWHARLRVFRDGAPVGAVADLTGCLVVPVLAGENRLAIVPGPDARALAGERLALAALLAWLAGLGVALAATVRRGQQETRVGGPPRLPTPQD